MGILGLAGCDSATSPDGHRDFIVDVSGERFVMRTTDPATIQQALSILAGVVRTAYEEVPQNSLRYPSGSASRASASRTTSRSSFWWTS